MDLQRKAIEKRNERNENGNMKEHRMGEHYINYIYAHTTTYYENKQNTLKSHSIRLIRAHVKKHERD